MKMNAAEAKEISEKYGVTLRQNAFEKAIEQIDKCIGQAAYTGIDHTPAEVRIPFYLFSTDEDIKKFNHKIKTEVRAYDYTISCRFCKFDGDDIVLTYNISW